MTSRSAEDLALREPEGWTRGFRAFRNYNYRLYWSGQFVSQCGTWMQNIAQGWLVLKLTNSAFDLGVVTALQQLPILLMGLLGGVIADRVPKYRLLVVTQSVMTVLALILAVDVTAGTVQIWHVYLLATALGVANAINNPAQQAFTVEMVGKEDLLNAIALNSTQFNSARIIGPAIAGVLIAVVGMALCFYLNALSFVAVIAALLLMRPNEFRINRAAVLGGSMRAQLGEGMNYIRRAPLLLTLMLLSLTAGTFAFNSNVVIPLIADQVLHKGAAVYGVMTSAMGIGAVITALTLAFGRNAKLKLAMCGLLGLVACAFVLAWSRFIPLSLIALVGMGGGMMAYATQVNTTVQTAVPDSIRGRVMSVYMMVQQGSQPMGAFLTGVFAAHLGAPMALTICASVCGFVVLSVLSYLPSRRAIASADRHPEPELALQA
jgi:MFS family permease